MCAAGIYTKQFENTGFSAGANYSVSRTDNVYTGLVPYSTYNNVLTVTWGRPLFDLQLYGRVWYAPDIIMTSIQPEQQQDGTWLYAYKPENQKSFTQEDVQAQLTIHAIKDKPTATCSALPLRGTSATAARTRPPSAA